MIIECNNLRGTVYVPQQGLKGQVSTNLSWDEDDPLVISANFTDSRGPHLWEISRQVLDEAYVKGVSGRHEVVVSYGGAISDLVVTLNGACGPDCTEDHIAVVTLNSASVRKFLDATYKRVSREAESGMVSEALDDFLEELMD